MHTVHLPLIDPRELSDLDLAEAIGRCRRYPWLWSVLHWHEFRCRRGYDGKDYQRWRDEAGLKPLKP